MPDDKKLTPEQLANIQRRVADDVKHGNTLSALTLIRDADKLLAHVAAQTAEINAERVKVANLKGAMDAQDARERAAGERCGVPYELHGCDWPDWVADKVLEQAAEIERLRNIADDLAVLCNKRDTEIERLRADLNKYGGHDPDCDLRRGTDPMSCDCGFTRTCND